jgi:hypothetical protein
MRTQLATSTRHHEHPPQSVSSPAAHVVRRVGPLDRAALHLGLALIKWGRRPLAVDVREQTASYAETHEARLECERVHAEYLAQSLNQFR